MFGRCTAGRQSGVDIEIKSEYRVGSQAQAYAFLSFNRKERKLKSGACTIRKVARSV